MKKKVAIVIPIYKEIFSEEEKISMKHLLYFLGSYDKYFVMPNKLKFKKNGFQNIKFQNKYFKSIKTYSKLLLSKKFYKQFLDYEYILIYQLDALVFSDQLLEWCNKNYDYIGAPWINSEMKKIFPHYYNVDCCGNGGFSLRKVNSFLEVLKKSYYVLAKKLLKDFFVSIKRKNYKNLLILIKKNIASYPYFYSQNEDFFWSKEAQKYYNNFKISPVNTGLKFAFEVGPRECFKRNNYKLPFGCHAWGKYDKKFWMKFLLK